MLSYWLIKIRCFPALCSSNVLWCDGAWGELSDQIIDFLDVQEDGDFLNVYEGSSPSGTSLGSYSFPINMLRRLTLLV